MKNIDIIQKDGFKELNAKDGFFITYFKPEDDIVSYDSYKEMIVPDSYDISLLYSISYDDNRAKKDARNREIQKRNEELAKNKNKNKEIDPWETQIDNM